MTKVARKRHILLLTDCLADLMGGAEKQIFELARRLDKERYTVTIASLECEGEAPRKTIESAGCRLAVFPVRRIYGLSGIREGMRFVRFLREKSIDAIMTYHFSSDIWGTVMARLAGVPLIISNRRDLGFWRSRRHILAYRFINRWVKRIVVVAEAVKHMVEKDEGVPERKIDVVYNGVEKQEHDQEALTALRAELELGVNDIIIMHVANLRPVKGHACLIEALRGIVPGNKNVKLLFIGEGELKESLQRKVEQAGLKDNVYFLGKRENARRLLPLADICVLPSLSEGMSNSILEYMAAGKPVVATRVGGNPELVEESRTGVLVEKENVSKLKEALEYFIQAPEDRERMGRNGLQKARARFSIDTMIDEYDKLFSCHLSFGKPKVLHLISSSGLFGAERVILDLVKNNDGFTFSVAALYNKHNPHSEVVEEARKLGRETALFDSFGPVDPRVIFQLKKYLLDNDIDILHTHNYKSDIIGCLAARLAGKKWVATNHLWHSRDRKMEFYERLDAYVLKSAECVFAVSDAIAEDLNVRHITRDRVKVIYNGIDVSQYYGRASSNGLKQSLGIKDDECIVSIVGRLSSEKGHDTFLQSALKVASQRPSVKFLIVGDGPRNDELKEKVKEMNLTGNVIFTGIRTDMPAVYAATDILVNASTLEGLPMTILEAMASKVAVIATPVGAVPKVIKSGINGLLFPPDDDKMLSEEIISLVDDSSKRKKLAESAYQTVIDNFNAIKMADKYKEAYKQLIEV